MYAEVLAKRHNADTMRIQVQIIPNADGLRIQFPDYVENIKGKIILYKPDNSKLDREIPIKLKPDFTQKISKYQLIPGRWDVKLDWKENEVPYFIEQKLTIK